MEDKRQLLSDLIAGRIAAKDFVARACRMNGVLIGIDSAGVVRWDNDGIAFAGSRADFYQAAQQSRKESILMVIVGPCAPVTNESDILDI